MSSSGNPTVTGCGVNYCEALTTCTSALSPGDFQPPVAQRGVTLAPLLDDTSTISRRATGGCPAHVRSLGCTTYVTSGITRDPRLGCLEALGRPEAIDINLYVFKILTCQYSMARGLLLWTIQSVHLSQAGVLHTVTISYCISTSLGELWGDDGEGTRQTCSKKVFPGILPLLQHFKHSTFAACSSVEHEWCSPSREHLKVTPQSLCWPLKSVSTLSQYGQVSSTTACTTRKPRRAAHVEADAGYFGIMESSLCICVEENLKPSSVMQPAWRLARAYTAIQVGALFFQDKKGGGWLSGYENAEDKRARRGMMSKQAGKGESLYFFEIFDQVRSVLNSLFQLNIPAWSTICHSQKKIREYLNIKILMRDSVLDMPCTALGAECAIIRRFDLFQSMQTKICINNTKHFYIFEPVQMTSKQICVLIFFFLPNSELYTKFIPPKFKQVDADQFQLIIPEQMPLNDSGLQKNLANTLPRQKYLKKMIKNWNKNMMCYFTFSVLHPSLMNWEFIPGKSWRWWKSMNLHLSVLLIVRIPT
ncbi:hypothetical protein VP01_1318g4 [Puccinia sorghi]|uniref:Uncharacterized protein n=1 Tax=Puccinia sorghi TaxID=27349 RepID=A0A0L6VMZ0_9BASI|nr:hypothetical protein VP01_1318g4 [Puccinia sorghi]